MATNGTTNYELRRQSRGGDAPAAAGGWRRRLIWGGIAVALAALIGGAVWAWYAYTRVHTVRARVRAAVVVLSPVAEARLLELHATERQRVNAGDVLARLDDSELRAELAAAEANRTICASRHEEARATVTMTEANVQVGIESARAEVAVAVARVASARSALALREKELVQETRRATADMRAAAAVLARLRKGARAEDIGAAAARVEAAKAQLALNELEVRQSQELVGEGIDSQYLLEVRRTRVLTQRNALRVAELELARLKAGARTEDVEVAEQTVGARAADLALAEARACELDALRAEIGVREAEREREKATLKQSEAGKTAVLVARERVRAAAAELEKAEAEVNGCKAALERMDIVSPVSGTVTRVFPNIGEVCRRGEPVILVVEDAEPRWIEAFVDEEDAMLVSVGQTAKVQVPAHVGDFVSAVVEQVGLHTESLDESGGAAGAPTARLQQPERVWVRIRPLAPLPGEPVTGTSARAIIRVR